MKPIIALILLAFSLNLPAQEQSIDDVAKTIRVSQIKDETNDWVYFGTYKWTVKGIDNSASTQLRIQDNTTVRMYLLAKTDCYTFFDVRDQKEAYIFGTNDPMSLETDISGFKAATSMYTYQKSDMMNINFGIRWGCKDMLGTELRLLVFYLNKNVAK